MKRKHLFILLLVLVAAQVQASILKEPAYKITVAQDGSGNFRTIQEALNTNIVRKIRTRIFIKNGIYKEKLVVDSMHTNIEFIGEDKDKTIITYDDHSGKGNINTFTSYTILIKAEGFRAENITFQNTAGKDASQAVALHVEADKCTFINYRLIGNQDTFYGGKGHDRQYFKDCYIEGTTDFIFGPSTVLFENCRILSKNNSYITAASTPENQPFGYVFLNCTLIATPEAPKVFLGRPWRNYAKTVFINTEMGAHIVPEGWHNWKKPEAEKTTFYAEYNSRGPGANPGKRVGWAKQLTKKEAKKYTVKNILSGKDNWNPKRG